MLSSCRDDDVAVAVRVEVVVVVVVAVVAEVAAELAVVAVTLQVAVAVVVLMLVSAAAIFTLQTTIFGITVEQYSSPSVLVVSELFVAAAAATLAPYNALQRRLGRRIHP